MSRRREADRDGIPITLYGLGRGSRALITVVVWAFGLFVITPLAWLIVNATKNQANVYQTGGFAFARPFRLFQNIGALFTSAGAAGVYARWMLNTAVYALVGSVGATLLAALAGYGFARFRFRGSQALFYAVLATLLIPITSVALPLYLVYAKVGLINTVWGMVLPCMVAPVAVYLMRTYIEASVPTELLEAGRIDGAGEGKLFLRIVVPLALPGMVTVFLLSAVAVWNNYFLPLLIFSRSDLYPLTVGLASLASAAETGSKSELVPVLIAGGLVTVLPLILLFLLLEKYFRRGAMQGSLTG